MHALICSCTKDPGRISREISDDAILYLDDLAITYFLHLGMLAKLKAAGLRAVASPKEISEANALISYEGISEQVKEAIERIRVALGSRIESGQVKVGRRCKYDEEIEQPIPEHPTIGLTTLALRCDAVIADDRLINQHLHIDNGTTQTPIFSTLDLLDALESGSVISEDHLLEYRTLIRRAGYFFVPVSEEELERYLKASAVEDGKVIETAELKAIRESVLRVRMGDWLQLPEEALWLDGTLKAYIHVLKKLWIDGADIAEVTARSNWIADQVDVRGWAHSFGPENGDNLVRIGTRGTYPFVPHAAFRHSARHHRCILGLGGRKDSRLRKGTVSRTVRLACGSGTNGRFPQWLKLS